MPAPALIPDVGRALIVQLAAFQAVLLLASGLHKMLKSGRMRTVVHEFAGVPGRLAPIAVVAAASAELLAGILLWTPALRAAGGALAALVWGGYLALILRAIAQGRRAVDCGCSFGPAQHALGPYPVIRNALLAGTAALVAAAAAEGAAGWVSAPEILASFALLALYGALDQVMTLMPPRVGALL